MSDRRSGLDRRAVDRALLDSHDRDRCPFCIEDEGQIERGEDVA